MKSAELKAAMLWHALYRLHFVAAITENGHGCIGVADVFGLLESGYTAEFEVKVSKPDLMGEIKSIRALAEKADLFADANKKVNLAKYPKHSLYLNGSTTYTDEMMGSLEMRPNKFFFVVTTELADVAKEGLAGTPYGLYVVDKNGNASHKKRAELLHTAKASNRLKLKILHSACTELETIRGQLAKGLRCTGCRDSLSTVCPNCIESRARQREYQKENERRWAEKNNVAT